MWFLLQYLPLFHAFVYCNVNPFFVRDFWSVNFNLDIAKEKTKKDLAEQNALLLNQVKSLTMFCSAQKSMGSGGL